MTLAVYPVSFPSVYVISFGIFLEDEGMYFNDLSFSGNSI
jgi:hypothetical protein